jgi:hypothetical protein
MYLLVIIIMASFKFDLKMVLLDGMKLDGDR